MIRIGFAVAAWKSPVYRFRPRACQAVQGKARKDQALPMAREVDFKDAKKALNSALVVFRTEGASPHRMPAVVVLIPASPFGKQSRL